MGTHVPDAGGNSPGYYRISAHRSRIVGEKWNAWVPDTGRECKHNVPDAGGESPADNTKFEHTGPWTQEKKWNTWVSDIREVGQRTQVS